MLLKMIVRSSKLSSNERPYVVRGNIKQSRVKGKT